VTGDKLFLRSHIPVKVRWDAAVRRSHGSSAQRSRWTPDNDDDIDNLILSRGSW